MEPRVLIRLTKEYGEMMSNPVEGISAGPKLGDKIFPNWDGFIHGPENSLYEGGVFKLSIVFPPDYPFKPPRLRFITKILNCNVGNGCIVHGLVCDYHMGLSWRPALQTTQKVLMKLRQSLIDEPDSDCILDSQLYKLWRTDREEYNRKVREATLQFALPQYNFDSDSDATDEEQSH